MLTDLLESGRALADAALERLLPPADVCPPSIHQAMRHSVFAGGKRLRPILCFEAARMIAAGAPLKPSSGLSGDFDSTSTFPPGVEDLGAALEMLHTYSLIHDDLPALDNDDLRRGRPTCHVAFGEAIAILAGDALQTRAYEVLAGLRCPPAHAIRVVGEIAHATGTIDGMIGGQVLDLEAERTPPDAQKLEFIHRSKTGALITASLVSGALFAGANDDQTTRVRNFGHKAGLAFQIADDVLDVTQSSEQLGKTAGKDVAAAKVTYPALFGVERSMQMARDYVKGAWAELGAFGSHANDLKELARHLVERKK